MQGGSKVKIYILVILVVCVGLLHFLIPTDTHTWHKVHIILRKLYYLPPVMAGAWFGLRGSFPVTLAVRLLFSLHAFLDWPGNCKGRPTRWENWRASGSSAWFPDTCSIDSGRC